MTYLKYLSVTYIPFKKVNCIFFLELELLTTATPVFLEEKILNLIITDYIEKTLFSIKANSGFEKIVKLRNKNDVRKDIGLYDA
jgi:hypothetical protein